MSGRLLLVALDGADSTLLGPLMASGKMPTLQRLVEQGASGSLLGCPPLIAAGQLSSMVTGKRPWQHRVCHQAELESSTGRFTPVSSRQLRSAPLWEVLQANGRKSLVVGWPATHASRGERLTCVSNRYSEAMAGPGVKPWPPAIPGTYWPEQLGATLDPLRVSPEDVQADLISHFVPNWKALDQKRDRRLSYLRIFLAADLSHHAAMMQLLKMRDWDFAAIHFPALGAITAMFLPFQEPRLAGVGNHEFELYRQVVPSAHAMLDRLLRSLIQIAGTETTVVVASPFGVSPQRPQRPLRAGEDEVWKSPYGLLALQGPGFLTNTQLLGASLLDLAPTLLTWFGIPIGDDMEGRVLLEAFEKLPEVRRVESWNVKQQSQPETVPSTTHACESPAATRYRLEYDWNLARAYLDALRFDEALPLLEYLFRSFPERADLGLALFQCQLTLKQTPAAAQTLEILKEVLPQGVESLLCQAELSISQARRKEVLVLVEQIRKLQPAGPVALRRLGMLMWRLRDWLALADLAQKVLELNPNEPLAWLAQAEASLRQRRFSEAFSAAQRAIGLNYFLPQAHLILSRVLLNQGKWAEAHEAMQVVLRLQPNNRAAATYWRRSGVAK